MVNATVCEGVIHTYALSKTTGQFESDALLCFSTYFKRHLEVDTQTMKFEAEQIYHLYNRGNNSQKIFFDHENYIFFLQKIRTHLTPVADILAYCLMPNHFHLHFYVPGKPEGLQKTHQVA